MHGVGGIECDFCDLGAGGRSDLFIDGGLVFFAASSFGATDILPGRGVICPYAHRETPFDLTPEEWTATHELMAVAKRILDERLRPDGYNLISNVGPDAGQTVAHAHMHLIPRFNDEPLAGRGARWHLKQPENLRPDPNAPGLGRAAH